MISFNNRNLCEFCFEELTPYNISTHHCTSCRNVEKYHSALSEGQVLHGKYIIGKVLGQGGFGITYLCYDTSTNTKVAIKEYFPAHCTHRNPGERTLRVNSEPEAFKKGLKKYREEANLLAKLRGHKGIVEVMSYFSENNTEYFVMEYLSGKDFKALKAENPNMEENYVIYLMMETLKTLTVIHSKSILHRDISPNNIFFCDSGHIKLIDFGASRIANMGASNSLSVILNPGFAPPEQYKKKGRQGPWTDIYALGSTMYFMLKGKLPEPATSRLVKDVLDLSGISTNLAYILTKMLALNIDMRYQRAEDVIRDLIALQCAETPSAGSSNNGAKAVPSAVTGYNTEAKANNAPPAEIVDSNGNKINLPDNSDGQYIYANSEKNHNTNNGNTHTSFGFTGTKNDALYNKIAFTVAGVCFAVIVIALLALL